MQYLLRLTEHLPFSLDICVIIRVSILSVPVIIACFICLVGCTDEVNSFKYSDIYFPDYPSIFQVHLIKAWLLNMSKKNRT